MTVDSFGCGGGGCWEDDIVLELLLEKDTRILGQGGRYAVGQ